MNKKTMMTLGIAMMFLGTTTVATAYHVPNEGDFFSNLDPLDPLSNAHKLPSTWVLGNPLLVLCESTGSNDKINPTLIAADLPSPVNQHIAVGFSQPGVGGLCYMSSQNFTECEQVTLPGGAIQNPVDLSCTVDKGDWKDKKPDQSATNTDWGLIEPTCTFAVVITCPPADGSDKNETGVGQSWFIRIGSNARSCDGAWGQTFIYKEAIAFYGGTDPNPSNGFSGHVTMFVNGNLVEDDDGTPILGASVAGGYNYDKVFDTTSSGAGIDAGKTLNTGQATPNCTGNASGWGLDDDAGLTPPKS